VRLFLLFEIKLHYVINMNTIVHKIERFFTSNTLWIYLTLLLFFSYLLLMSLVKDSLANYLTTALKLCSFYTPALVFALFRNAIKDKLGSTINGVIWVLCFVLCPFLVYYFGDYFVDILFDKGQELYHPNVLDDDFPSYFFIIVGSSVLATEIALLFNDNLIEKIKNSEWIKGIEIEKMMLYGVGLLAMISGLVKTFDVAANYHFVFLIWKFISFSLQFLLIYLVYFFYFYVNKAILIPKVLKTKGVIYYAFSVVMMIVFCYPIFTFLLQFLPMATELKLDLIYPSGKTFAHDGGGLPFTILILTVPIIVSNEWFSQGNQIANLEKEKSETELSLLKQQINPHFFFNTLNNLYALSITKDKQTPEVILQLSELMRYVIYKGKENQVSLKEEVKYIEDYIQLQQIRLHKKLDFEFDKNIENEHLQIPPLLFITFVENAFKHGIEPAEGECFLHLKLDATENDLTFTCTNSFEEKPTDSPGIGLENLKRRLALRFPNQHQIETKEGDDNFIASLSLKVNNR